MPRWFALSLWLIALALLGGYAATALRIDTDLPRFVLAQNDPWQNDLADVIRTSPTGQLVVLRVTAPRAETAADASQALKKQLAASGAFSSINNGDLSGDTSGAQREFASLSPYRYVLSDRIGAEHFSAANLSQHLKRAGELLTGSSGYALADVLPRDPTLESLHMLQGLAQGNALPKQHGVWFSKDGQSALLLAITQAAANELQGQQQAADAIETAIATLRRNDAFAALTVDYSSPGLLALHAREITQQRVRLIGYFSTGLVLLLLIAAYRRALPIAVTLIPAAVGFAAGLAATQLAFGSVHVLALAFASILLGEAVDYPSYVFTQARSGQALQTEMPRIWRTLWIAVATSAAAFALLLAADFRGLQQLGLLCCVGIVGGGVATRWLLPLLLGKNYIIAWRTPQFAQRWAQRWNDIAQGIQPQRTRIALMLALAACGAAALALFNLQPRWNDNLAAMNPLPQELVERDTALRRAIGAPDAGRMIVLRAPDAQTLLRAQEALRAPLQRLQNSGVFGDAGSFDMAANLVPSEATQRARLAALPSAAALRAQLAQAVKDSPFNADAFEPFLQDIEAARSKLLTPQALPAGFFALRAGSLLRETPRGWIGLILLPSGAPREPVEAAVFAAARTQGVEPHWFDTRDSIAALMRSARGKLLWLFAACALVIVAVVAAHQRSLRAAARTLLPVGCAIVLSAAAVRVLFGPLSVFDVVALMLVAGVATNYALFFAPEKPIPAPTLPLQERGKHLPLQAGGRQRDGLDANAVFSVLLTSATTLVVFAVLAVCGIQIAETIGRAVFIGVAVSVLSIAVLRLWTVRSATTRSSR